MYNNIDSKANVRKGSWTDEEDILLRKCIEKYGEGNWHRVPVRAGLNRCRKSCRLRWMNYLKPNIKRGQFNEDEVDLIVRLHKLLGNRWSLIAGRIPGRTANDVKNYWNTHLIKKLSPSTRPPKHPSTSRNNNNDNNNDNNNNNNIITKEVTTCATKTTRTHPKIIKPQPWSFPRRPGPIVMGPPTSSHDNGPTENSTLRNSEEEHDEDEDDDGNGRWWEKLVEMYDQKEDEEEEEEEVMDTSVNNGLNDMWPTFTTSTNQAHELNAWDDDDNLWNFDVNVWD